MASHPAQVYKVWNRSLTFNFPQEYVYRVGVMIEKSSESEREREYIYPLLISQLKQDNLIHC